MLKLIFKLSFKLTFWTWIEIESSCSHFQLNLSRIAHIFNSTRLNSTENWVNSTWFTKNLSLTSRELNIEKISVFDFCITFLHYLLIESHKEKHEDHLIKSHKKKHEDCLIESHNEKYEEKHKEKHKEKHDEKHDEKTWRSFDFDRKSWRENMVESHEEKSCRLFNQAIYIYLISCRVKSNFWVELLSQASQFNSSAWVQLLNSTRHFFKKISTQLNTFRIEYSTWTQILDLTQSVYLCSTLYNESWCFRMLKWAANVHIIWSECCNAFTYCWVMFMLWFIESSIKFRRKSIKLNHICWAANIVSSEFNRSFFVILFDSCI